jgi:hypothetical protein
LQTQFSGYKGIGLTIATQIVPTACYVNGTEKSNPHAYKELSSCVGEKVVLTYYLLSQKSNWNKTIAVTAVNK